MSLSGWEWLGFRLNDCPKFILFETKTSFKLAEGFWELIVISWTSSFIIRRTESRPKSRNHWISLLETAKIMLLNLGQKMRKEMEIESPAHFNKHKEPKTFKIYMDWIFLFFLFKFGCGRLWLTKNCFHERNSVFFSLSELVFYAEQSVSTLPKTQCCVSFENYGCDSWLCTLYSPRN